MREAGGVYAVMNELSKKDLLNLDCVTVTGKTVGENIKNCFNLDNNVCRERGKQCDVVYPYTALIYRLCNNGGCSALCVNKIKHL